MKLEAKKKRKAEWTTTVKTHRKPRPTSATTTNTCQRKVYIPDEWFKMVKEEDKEEAVLYYCRTIIIDFDFHELNGEIT